ncbi:MAG: hypothetical protein U5R14_11430 [Gemmatimonadota bacterium]|nr:hypothetical protein [Gemmatimonadota bacterium]
MPTLPTHSSARLWMAVAFVFGLAGTLGVVAVGYGDGTAYLSDDPTACVQCHVMEDQFASWAFTFRNHPDPIRIKPRNRAIAEANCVGCHEDLTHAIRTSESTDADLSCLHCHKDVGHAAFR